MKFMISIKLLLIAPLLSCSSSARLQAGVAELAMENQNSADETQTVTLDITGMT